MNSQPAELSYFEELIKASNNHLLVTATQYVVRKGQDTNQSMCGTSLEKTNCYPRHWPIVKPCSLYWFIAWFSRQVA